MVALPIQKLHSSPFLNLRRRFWLSKTLGKTRMVRLFGTEHKNSTFSLISFKFKKKSKCGSYFAMRALMRNREFILFGLNDIKGTLVLSSLLDSCFEDVVTYDATYQHWKFVFFREAPPVYIPLISGGQYRHLCRIYSHFVQSLGG